MTTQARTSTDGLRIEISFAADRTVVALHGALDVATASSLSETFGELARRGVVQIDLDLARCEFMDSTGLAVVVAEHQRTKAEGGGLVIHHPARRIIRLFQSNGLMSYLVVQPRMST